MDLVLSAQWRHVSWNKNVIVVSLWCSGDKTPFAFCHPSFSKVSRHSVQSRRVNVNLSNGSTHPATVATATISAATLAPGPDRWTARAQHLKSREKKVLKFGLRGENVKWTFKYLDVSFLMYDRCGTCWSLSTRVRSVAVIRLWVCSLISLTKYLWVLMNQVLFSCPQRHQTSWSLVMSLW